MRVATPAMPRIQRSVIDPAALAAGIADAYKNVRLARVNDHEIRMSVMTKGYPWHRHPDSDETFVGVAGELVIEFDDHQLVVGPGEIATVPAGVRHRTRPLGARSVNLTFERIRADTAFEE